VTRAANGEVIVKLVNFHNSSSYTLSLHVDDDWSGDSQLQSSAPLQIVAASSVYGHAADENSLDAPEKIRIRQLTVDHHTPAEVVLLPLSVSCVRLARRLQTV
jgi:hypothetical protein